MHCSGAFGCFELGARRSFRLVSSLCGTSQDLRAGSFLDTYPDLTAMPSACNPCVKLCGGCSAACLDVSASGVVGASVVCLRDLDCLAVVLRFGELVLQGCLFVACVCVSVCVSCLLVVLCLCVCVPVCVLACSLWCGVVLVGVSVCVLQLFAGAFLAVFEAVLVLHLSGRRCAGL